MFVITPGQKIVSSTVTVEYSTFNTLTNPCAYLQSNLLSAIRVELNISGTVVVSSCTVISQSKVGAENFYTFSVALQWWLD